MSDESKPKLKYPAKSFFYSVAEAAMILRVSTKAIRTWIDDGLLPAFRIGPETRITRIRSQDLDDFSMIIFAFDWLTFSLSNTNIHYFWSFPKQYLRQKMTN